MAKITINGVTYQGNNVTVVNDDVIIDGNNITIGATKEPIKVFVKGNLESLKCHIAEITGDVYNDVDAHNVTCDTIGGNVDAHKVTCEFIRGKVNAHTVKTLKK